MALIIGQIVPTNMKFGKFKYKVFPSKGKIKRKTEGRMMSYSLTEQKTAQHRMVKS